MGCNASVEDGDESPQGLPLGKSEKGKSSLQRISVLSANAFAIINKFW